MSEISENINIESALEEALNKINGSEETTEEILVQELDDPNALFDSLMNSGESLNKKPSKKSKSKEEEIESEEKEEEFDKSKLSFEDFCAYELQRAHDENKPDPDFDFRNFYQKGDIIFLVRYYSLLNEKVLIKAKLRTIYPRLMVGVIDKYGCECIGYTDRDHIFFSESDAKDYYDQLSGVEEDLEKEHKGSGEDED